MARVGTRANDCEGFLDAAVAQEGPGCRHLDKETEGAPSKSGSPHRSRQHPQKYRNGHLEEECTGVHPTSEKGDPRRRRTTQKVVHCR
ncbi:hypothetical protein NDU88_009245 [Pleurodeles waltl]|uniref:Uncharacterized protein n=1 Tax=Pleurodeles waltl TaxID=8319 RepID=A0AAV7PU13_PLEWA|nr:hypothetical protein NDU88_009245 [Pleurodeles waltl]